MISDSWGGGVHHISSDRITYYSVLVSSLSVFPCPKPPVTQIPSREDQVKKEHPGGGKVRRGFVTGPTSLDIHRTILDWSLGGSGLNLHPAVMQPDRSRVTAVESRT